MRLLVDLHAPNEHTPARSITITSMNRLITASTGTPMGTLMLDQPQSSNVAGRRSGRATAFADVGDGRDRKDCRAVRRGKPNFNAPWSF
jgi:hypothetical protein